MRLLWEREKARADKAERAVEELTDYIAAMTAGLSLHGAAEWREIVAQQMSAGGRLRWVIEFLVGSDIPGAARVAEDLDRIAAEVDKRAARGKIYLL